MRTLLALAAASATIGPAVAADWPMSIRRDLHHLAKCLIEVEPGRARQVLALPIGSVESVRLTGRMTRDHGGCLRGIGSERMPHVVLVGAMAEAMLHRRPELLEVASSATPQPSIRPSAEPNKFAFLVAYGQCLAQNSPRRAVAVIRTDEASAEEQRAVLGLEHYLSDCMPGGVQYTLHYGEMRTVLAAAVYSIATTPAAPSPLSTVPVAAVTVNHKWSDIRACSARNRSAYRAADFAARSSQFRFRKDQIDAQA